MKRDTGYSTFLLATAPPRPLASREGAGVGGQLLARSRHDPRRPGCLLLRGKRTYLRPCEMSANDPSGTWAAQDFCNAKSVVCSSLKRDIVAHISWTQAPPREGHMAIHIQRREFYTTPNPKRRNETGISEWRPSRRDGNAEPRNARKLSRALSPSSTGPETDRGGLRCPAFRIDAAF
jgi:hypothetical protein